MDTSLATTLARRLLEESGLASSYPAIDVDLVDRLLAEHFHLGGRLERLATEKDDTFRLRGGSSGPPREGLAAEASLSQLLVPSTAVMRHLEDVAPELPVPRVS